MAVDKATRNRQNAASRKRYEDKTYDKLSFRLRKDGADGITADGLRAAAAAAGMSVNAYVIDILRREV